MSSKQVISIHSIKFTDLLAKTKTKEKTTNDILVSEMSLKCEK
uniref:Uncharacterized protein n=1 Tax=Rhizophora mucronata TaxID=61149 RepID=A0A2P2QYM0_RHIMU